jgi:23S rRNA pseudouridine1911/1915/1917 synthase
MSKAIDLIASGSDAGERLDAFVSRHARISRAHVARLIADGDVQVDGSRAAKSLRLAPGMRIHVVVEEPAAKGLAAEDLSIPVIHEDEDVLVISKPAGLVVHPGPGHASGTLANALLRLGAAGGDPDRPGIVHRLDAGTSGLMIVARSAEAYTRLAAAMAAREITRTYLALVEGQPDTDALTIDAPIGRSPRHRKKMAVVARGREAVTRVTVLERHARTALVEAKPYTGRTHQIRVHLAVAGHPIVGDAVYGKDRRLADALELDRPFLHAAALSFAHPVTGVRLDLRDPLPPDLERALERARG